MQIEKCLIGRGFFSRYLDNSVVYLVNVFGNLSTLNENTVI